MGIHEYAEKRATLGTQDTWQRQTKLNTTTQQKTIKIVTTEPIQEFTLVLTQGIQFRPLIRQTKIYSFVPTDVIHDRMLKMHG
jgi:hypothetical protein